jgi:hypothetical protein
MNRRSVRTLTTALMAALLSASACGGSDTPTEAEDKAMAERIVLTSADLPGFTMEPDDGDDESAGSFEDCLNDNPLLVGDNKPRSANGADFTQDDGNVRVQSGAFVAAKVDEAGRAFSDIATALSSQCLKDGLARTIRAGSDPGVVVRDITAEPLPEIKVADDYAATRLTVPLEVGRERAAFHVDMTFLRTGRVLAGVFTFQAGAPFPDAERSRLVRLVGERVNGKARNTPDTGPRPTAAAPTVVSPSTTSAATTGAFTVFRDPSGVSLEHPRTWTVEPSAGTDPLVVFLDPPSGVPFRRNVNILVQSGARPLTLDEYTQISLRQINDIEGATIGESRPTTLSGSPAYRLAYRGDLGSGDLRFLAVWTVRSGKAWLVTFASDPGRYNASLPEIERLLTTIQLPA